MANTKKAKVQAVPAIDSEKNKSIAIYKSGKVEEQKNDDDKPYWKLTLSFDIIDSTGSNFIPVVIRGEVTKIDLTKDIAKTLVSLGFETTAKLIELDETSEKANVGEKVDLKKLIASGAHKKEQKPTHVLVQEFVEKLEKDSLFWCDVELVQKETAEKKGKSYIYHSYEINPESLEAF